MRGEVILAQGRGEVKGNFVILAARSYELPGEISDGVIRGGRE